MLSEKEYNDLWITSGIGALAKVKLPLYEDYVRREIYLADYLDLFRGRVTYKRETIEKCLSVKMYGKWIRVDYDHPFQKDFGEKRKIKNVLIAEAPRPMSASTYFYHHLHTSKTPYFSAPLAAFNIKKKPSKKHNLIDLANAGVLLLDLLPFSIDLNTLRKGLIGNSIADAFWSNLLNPYTLEKRIDLLQKEKIFNGEVKATMMAPRTLSHHLIEGMLFRSLPDFGFTWRNVVNTFVPPHSITKGPTTFSGTLGHKLIGVPPHRYTLKGINEVPVFASNTSDGSGNPNSTLIKNALGLP